MLQSSVLDTAQAGLRACNGTFECKTNNVVTSPSLSKQRIICYLKQGEEADRIFSAPYHI